eukprot:SAG11_NODE_37408_length_257_cov_0.639241_1_plen_80_part_10
MIQSDTFRCVLSHLPTVGGWRDGTAAVASQLSLVDACAQSFGAHILKLRMSGAQVRFDEEDFSARSNLATWVNIYGATRP